ncbi:MAG: APC family permease [Salinisphaera sp.]|nr:APC family permease [Salinisphaera sp.]
MTTSPADPHAQGDGSTPLRRVINRPLLVLFVTGDILGAGIYAVAGKVAGETGGALWAPMLAAFALALLTALSYAELVTKYPRAAGAALYVHKAFGVGFVTFLTAVAVMASGIASAGTSALAFGGDYLGAFIAMPQGLASLGFLLVLAAINYHGISTSIWVNLVLTLVEASGLVVVICLGFIAIGNGAGEISRAFTFDPEAGMLLAIAGGTALAFFSFVGFEDAVNVAEEARNPRRDYPLALVAGLIIALVFYLLVVFVAAVLVPIERLAGSSAPLLEVVQLADPGFPVGAFAIMALLAVTNTALINLIMASRLLYGLANQGLVPRIFARVGRRRQTPWVSILLVTAVAGALVLTGSIGALASTTVVLLLSVFVLVNVSVLFLRRDPIDQPHFRTPTLLPILGAMASGALVLFTVANDPWVAARAVVLLLLGAMLWALRRAWAR